MDIKDLRTLIKMVTETDITEFEMESTDEKIVIKRGKGQEIVHLTAPAQIYPAPAAATGAAYPAAASAPLPAAAAAQAVSEKYDTITSPIVGTFYRAPSPDSDPYVQVGSVIEKGQIFCIVEAMKLMNEIEADIAGTVVAVLAEDGAPVEYGQALFKIAPG